VVLVAGAYCTHLLVLLCIAPIYSIPTRFTRSIQPYSSLYYIYTDVLIEFCPARWVPSCSCRRNLSCRPCRSGSVLGVAAGGRIRSCSSPWFLGSRSGSARGVGLAAPYFVPLAAPRAPPPPHPPATLNIAAPACLPRRWDLRHVGGSPTRSCTCLAG
jgi:hypothetical protein